MQDNLGNSKIPHILIVTSTFYKDIADELVRGAIIELDKVEASYQIISVPGAFEIPAAISFAFDTDFYDGFIALGCVIKGETAHFDVVCNENARGINDIAINLGAAIGYGVITCFDKKQAMERASIYDKNIGGMAAKTCLQMIKVKNAFASIIKDKEDMDSAQSSEEVA